MSATIIKPDSQEHWLALRKQGIACSDVAAILGHSNFANKTARSVYRDKKGIEQTKVTRVMDMGSILEPYIISEYAKEKEKDIVKNEDFFIDGLFRGTPDVLDKQEDAVDDIKSIASKYIYKAWSKLPTNMSTDHFLQLNGYMYLTGAPRARIVAMTRDTGELLYTPYVEFDKDFFNRALEQVYDFWEKNVLAEVEPPEVEEEKVTSNGSRIVLTDSQYEALQEFITARDAETKYKKEKETLRPMIDEMIGAAEEIEWAGRVVAVYPSSTKTALDQEILKTLYPEIYDKCLQTKPTRTLRKKK